MTQKISTISHQVYFWLKNPESSSDLDKLIAGLKTLASVEQVRGIHIGTPAPTDPRPVIDSSYQAALLLFFDNSADQDAYQIHPIHKKFVGDCSSLWSKVVVYDAKQI